MALESLPVILATLPNLDTPLKLLLLAVVDTASSISPSPSRGPPPALVVLRMLVVLPRGKAQRWSSDMGRSGEGPCADEPDEELGGVSPSPGTGDALGGVDAEEGSPNWKSGAGSGPGPGEDSVRAVMAYRRVSYCLREGTEGEVETEREGPPSGTGGNWPRRGAQAWGSDAR